MKIAFLLNSVSRNSAGLFEVCRRLAQMIAGSEEVFVLGVRDEFTSVDLPDWRPLKPLVFASSVPGGFAFARHYAKALREIAPDIVHVHALWIYPSLVGYRWHRQTKRPLIYSAHGMLDPWALRNSGWKKRIVRALWEDAAHGQASCFHVNSEGEYQSLRRYGLRNPVCIIPNGVDLPEAGDQAAEVGGQRSGEKKVLLYLGRLHPKKNLSSMLKAWSTVQRESRAAKEWVLMIAGWDQGGYESELKELTSDLGLLSSVTFFGSLFGDEKAAAYRNADAFVLPSLSEGLPMVVLEAWAYGKPVLMTPECNLPEGFLAEAALRIGTTDDEIARGFRQVIEMSDTERTEMGSRGRTLVVEKFSWSRIGEEFRAVYRWVLGGGEPPETVRLN